MSGRAPSAEAELSGPAGPSAGLRRHLNAAGAALPTELVLDTVVAQLRLEARLGGYDAANARQRDLQGVYDGVGRLLGVQPDDVALVESATVGWQRLLDAMRLRSGARVIATRSTYVSMALSLLELERTRGITVDLLPCDRTGGVDLDALARALERPAAFVTTSHVPTSSGLIEPVAAIGALARAAGTPFVLDATQSVGQLRVDAQLIGADAIFATGRKFLRAPRGTGFLYVSPAMRAGLRPLNPDVRGAEWLSADGYELADTSKRFETWEASQALRLGLGAALGQLEEAGIDAVSARIGGLARTMRERLAAVPGVEMVDPPAADGSGIVTFVVGGEDPRETVARLARARIHLLAVPAAHGQWDLGARGLSRVVRASVHLYNDESDVDAVETVIRRPRTLVQAAAPRATPAVVGRAADVVVVGAGIHGRSTAWALARRGFSVLQIEQFGAGHVEGSSHGATRMIRRAYPNPVWDPFVETAYKTWDELSEIAGEPLLAVVGGLYSRPDATPGGLRGPGCRTVDAAQARDLFPGLRVPAGATSLYDPAAGILRADAAMAALRRLGLAAGVSVREDTRVLSWREEGDGVVVETSAGMVSAGRLVVCAGPWTGSLLPEFAGRLSVVRIVNSYLASSVPESVAAPNLGAFSFQTDEGRLLYGFPAFDGRGLKVGLDDGPPDDVDAARAPASAAEEATLRALAQRYVPGADGPVVESLTCRYTMAPNNRFAIGAVPGRGRVLTAVACSGHAFKFGPAVGEALADLVDGVDRPDLEFLAPARMLQD
jgi:cysteine desulfurase/selenocysteine lyase